jgi:hypothetical protein
MKSQPHECATGDSEREDYTIPLIDRCTRKCVAIDVDTSRAAAWIVRVLERVISVMGTSLGVRVPRLEVAHD